MRIRQPIISVLGHVDSGKTTLLDRIRGSTVASGESGGITQHIGASEIPIKNVRDLCGNLLERMKVDLKIPGLLFIDTPGHEAFTTLRKRGGSISDLAILIVDINEGFQPQTEESLLFLKEFKTPFVVALTKIDRILGYRSSEGACFLDNYRHQDERVQDQFEEKLYRVIGQLGEKGFPAERYDRVEDYSKQISVVPVSGVTGEGVQDLLVLIAGLSQKFLEKRLEITSEIGKGTVLEVRDFKGMGTTLDVILYDGIMRRGDFLVIGGKETVLTKVKALMKPEPLKEIRVERKFLPISEVSAAAGVKISAMNIESVIAGSPLRSVRKEEDIKSVEQDITREIEEVEIETENEGIIIKADTLGSLEALIKTLKEMGMPIRKAKVGPVLKSDVMESSGMKKKIIFAFRVDMFPDAKEIAKKEKVKVISSDVIYKLMDDLREWEEDTRKRKEKAMLDSVTRPGRMRMLPGYVFRQCKPAVFGVEVTDGIIRTGYRIRKGDKIVGEIKELQAEGENVQEGKAGDKLAVSMEGVTIGRQINEGDTLENALTSKEIETLSKLKPKLTASERNLLEEIIEKQ
ncbi:MAG: translation initiation factor IF-2 [Candidatus Aenigmarchaeota archaeon]|nr:translation initiation factor IF-2 [Candidatus Aenigmarchaeota archaeon]